MTIPAAETQYVDWTAGVLPQYPPAAQWPDDNLMPISTTTTQSLQSSSNQNVWESQNIPQTTLPLATFAEATVGEAHTTTTQNGSLPSAPAPSDDDAGWSHEASLASTTFPLPLVSAQPDGMGAGASAGAGASPWSTSSRHILTPQYASFPTINYPYPVAATSTPSITTEQWTFPAPPSSTAQPFTFMYPYPYPHPQSNNPALIRNTAAPLALRSKSQSDRDDTFDHLAHFRSPIPINNNNVNGHYANSIDHVLPLPQHPGGGGGGGGGSLGGWPSGDDRVSAITSSQVMKHRSPAKRGRQHSISSSSKTTTPLRKRRPTQLHLPPPATDMRMPIRPALHTAPAAPISLDLLTISGTRLGGDPNQVPQQAPKVDGWIKPQDRPIPPVGYTDPSLLLPLFDFDLALEALTNDEPDNTARAVPGPGVDAEVAYPTVNFPTQPAAIPPLVPSLHHAPVQPQATPSLVPSVNQTPSQPVVQSDAAAIALQHIAVHPQDLALPSSQSSDGGYMVTPGLNGLRVVSWRENTARGPPPPNHASSSSSSAIAIPIATPTPNSTTNGTAAMTASSSGSSSAWSTEPTVETTPAGARKPARQRQRKLSNTDKPSPTSPEGPSRERAVCEVCHMSLSRGSDLQRHMRKHTGERPFHCPYCHSTFARNDKLQTHVGRQHHGYPEFRVRNRSGTGAKNASDQSH